MVVELHERGKSSTEIARDLDIATDLVKRWYREYATSGEGSFTGNGNPVFTPELREISLLNKALKEAQIERDILKRAVSIFSRSDSKYLGS